jgi:hypothetical protein
MDDQNMPGPGRSTSEAAIREIKKGVAQRNEAAQKEGRKKRTAREMEKLKNLRRWERM